MRLLCVEDETALREDIAEYLRMQQYEVDEAETGEEAIEQLSRNHYDLVLCDIKMPRMNGYELLKQVRGENNLVTTPFIFLSALNEKDDKLRAQAGGCDTYLTKPIDFSLLAATLKSHLERQQARNFVFDSTLESMRSHIMHMLDNALSGPVYEAMLMTDHLRESIPVVAPSKLDDDFTRLENALSKHADDLHMLQHMFTMQIQPANLVRQSVSVSKLLQKVLSDGSTMLGRSTKTKAPSELMEHISVDENMISAAMSSLRNAIPKAFLSEESLHISVVDNFCIIEVSDHPSKTNDQEDFMLIDATTNLIALSNTTRQRLIPLMFAMQVAQAHGGRIEIKLWPDDSMAVRLILPQTEASAMAA